MQKRVLITGTSSHQYSYKTAERNTSFAHILSKALKFAGCDVDIDRPYANVDKKFFDDYDRVFVGISPLMSVTANGAYGALNTIGSLVDTGKLTLFFDTPEPWKFFANLRSIEKDTDQLFKPFYKKRLDYAAATSSAKSRKNIVKAIDVLSTSIPPVIYPVLPWGMEKNLPSVPEYAVDAFHPVPIDSFVFDTPMQYSETRHNTWIVDSKTRWARNAVNTLGIRHLEFSEIKSDIAEVIRSSFGVLIGSHDDGVTWWSPRYAQAISLGTPIATDWRCSGSLGQSWMNLPGTIEEMSQVSHYELTMAQRFSYIGALPSKNEVLDDILVTARIT